MPKQVRKAKLERKEKMHGAGEMVVGRMATRSFERESFKKARQDLMSSLEYKEFLKWAKKHKKQYQTVDEENERFKIWQSTKESIKVMNSTEPPGGATYGLNMFADITDIERVQFWGGRKPADDPYQDNEPTPEFYESKLGKEVAKEEAAFAEWEAEHNKTYRDEFEREDRFAIYFRNKKMIEAIRKEVPFCSSTYPPELVMNMDQPYNGFTLKDMLTGSAPSN